MKNYFLFLLSTLFLILSIIGCSFTSSTLSSTQDVKLEIQKQIKYYSGMWHDCIINGAFDGTDVDKVTQGCKNKLKSYLDKDWYINGRKITNIPLPSKESEFKSNQEYNYYLGVWEQCISDVVIAGQGVISDNQMIDYCSNNLKEGVNKDWYSEKDSTFPIMPNIVIATEEPQG